MFCPNCGQQIPDNSRFCGRCGAQLGGAQTQGGQPGVAPQQSFQQVSRYSAQYQAVQPKKKSKVGIIIAIVAAVVVIAVAVFLITGLHKSDSSGNNASDSASSSGTSGSSNSGSSASTNANDGTYEVADGVTMKLDSINVTPAEGWNPCTLSATMTIVNKGQTPWTPPSWISSEIGLNKTDGTTVSGVSTCDPSGDVAPGSTVEYTVTWNLGYEGDGSLIEATDIYYTSYYKNKTFDWPIEQYW